MLTEQKLQSLKHIIQDSSRDEIIWMSGFLAGLVRKKCIIPHRLFRLTEPAAAPKNLLFLFCMEQKQATQKKSLQNLHQL